jgi:hypothetical protein
VAFTIVVMNVSAVAGRERRCSAGRCGDDFRIA